MNVFGLYFLRSGLTLCFVLGAREHGKIPVARIGALFITGRYVKNTFDRLSVER